MQRPRALQFASNKGIAQALLAQALLAAGADVKAADDRNDTALHQASKKGPVAIGQARLEAGASANAADWAISLLHWTCVKGHLAVVQALLNAGADVKARESGFRTPEVLAL